MPCPLFRALTAAVIFFAGTPLVQAATVTSAPAPTPIIERPQGDRSGLTLTTLDENAAFALSQSVIGTDVGDHVLLDREGRPTRLAQFRGKPLVVNFIYTSCFQVCPTTTRNLKKAAEAAASVLGPERFNIISIGFNQPFDSPESMKSFASQSGVDLPYWHFLSPAAAIVPDLAKNFGFSFVATTAGFDHISQVTLVDSQGKIVRQIYGETPNAADLVEPLKRLVAGAPIPEQTVTLSEIADRIRILCSVYDPVTGKYRTKLSLYLEIAGVITALGFTAWVAVDFTGGRRKKKKNPVG